MRALTTEISTKFSLSGVRQAVADARSLASGVKDALSSVGKSTPLDGLQKGIRDAKRQAEAARDAVQGAAAKGGTASVTVEAKGVREATGVVKGFVASIRAALGGVGREADAAGEKLAKTGPKGRAALDDVGKAARSGAGHVRTMTEAANGLVDRVTAVGTGAARAGTGLAGAFGGRVLGGLREAAGLVAKVAAVGTVIAGLSGVTTGGAFGALTEGTADYVREIERLSNVTGIQVEAFSRLASIARSSGVDLDGLRGSLIQFAGQAAAAARGEDVKKYFDQLGVSATDANGAVKDTLSLVLEVAQAQKTKVTGVERAGLLAQLFGEDDSARVAPLLDRIGGSLSDVTVLLDKANKAGTVVNKDDIKMVQGYKEALASITEPLRGVAMAISREVLPNVTEFSNTIGKALLENKDTVVKYGVKAWSLLSTAIRDVLRYFTGNQEYIQNGWMVKLLDTAKAVGGALGTAGRAVLEFGDVLRGKTQADKDFEFPWLFSLKARLDRAFGAGGRVLDAFFDLFKGRTVDVQGSADKVNDAIDGMADNLENALRVLNGTAPATTPLGKVVDDAKSAVAWLDRLRNAVALIASGQGDKVDAEFKWVANLAKAGESTLGTLQKLGEVALEVATQIQTLLDSMGVTGDGFATFAGSAAGFLIVLAAVLAPIKLLTATLGAVGLAAAAPAAVLLALAGAAALVWKRVYDNWQESKRLEAETRKSVEDANASLEQAGIRKGGERAYIANQNRRRALGLDADEEGRVPRGNGRADYYEERDGQLVLVRSVEGLASAAKDLRAALPERTAAQDDGVGSLRALLDQAQRAASAQAAAPGTAGADLTGALAAVQRAGDARGQAITAAGRAGLAPRVPGAAATEAAPGQKLAFTVIAGDGSQQTFDMAASPPDVVQQFADAVGAARRARATQTMPSFMVQRG